MNRLNKFGFLHIIKSTSLLIAALFLTACVGIEVGITSFKKVKTDDLYDYFIYKTYADTANKIDSPEAEVERIRVLNHWIKQNNLPTKYELINRDVYNKIGNIKDVYYEIRILRK